jgi:transcriptional regulator with XRE-family HTH domain
VSRDGFLPDPVEVHIGAMLARLRVARGLTGRELADRLGLTNQVVSNYENARARITVARLWDAAQFFQVPIETFFPARTGAGLRELPDLPPDPRFAGVSRLSVEDQRRVLGLIRRLLDLPDDD